MSDTAQTVIWSLGEVEETGKTHEKYFWLVPGKESLADRLDEIIVRLGLQSRLTGLFQMTKPRWFGFWIDSPLSQAQCSLLYDICIELSKKSPRYRDNIREFVEALGIARHSNLPLHVRLSAPGHSDFGFYRPVPRQRD